MASSSSPGLHLYRAWILMRRAVIFPSCPGREEDRNVEGLACAVVAVRHFFATVVFTDEHSECRNGMPVALVRGCAVARSPGELERLLCPGLCAEGVRLYVEPGTNANEVSALWAFLMAGAAFFISTPFPARV
jgi:hypothetical protein